jgi:hypothetical protein
MELLTKEIERRFAQVGDQSGLGDDAIVVAKFFTPDSSWTWYATEYQPEERLFFGLVDGFVPEFGYFSLDELLTAKGPRGLNVERDIHWKELTAGKVKNGIVRRMTL